MYRKQFYQGTFVAPTTNMPSDSDIFSSKVPIAEDEPLFPLSDSRSKKSDSHSSMKMIVGLLSTAIWMRCVTAADATPWYFAKSFPTDIFMKQKSPDLPAAHAAALASKVCNQICKYSSIVIFYCVTKVVICLP